MRDILRLKRLCKHINVIYLLMIKNYDLKYLRKNVCSFKSDTGTLQVLWFWQPRLYFIKSVYMCLLNVLSLKMAPASRNIWQNKYQKHSCVDYFDWLYIFIKRNNWISTLKMFSVPKYTTEWSGNRLIHAYDTRFWIYISIRRNPFPFLKLSVIKASFSRRISYKFTNGCDSFDAVLYIFSNCEVNHLEILSAENGWSKLAWNSCTF